LKVKAHLFAQKLRTTDVLTYVVHVQHRSYVLHMQPRQPQTAASKRSYQAHHTCYDCYHALWLHHRHYIRIPMIICVDIYQHVVGACPSQCRLLAAAHLFQKQVPHERPHRHGGPVGATGRKLLQQQYMQTTLTQLAPHDGRAWQNQRHAPKASGLCVRCHGKEAAIKCPARRAIRHEQHSHPNSTRTPPPPMLTYILVVTVGSQPAPQLARVCNIAQVQEPNLHRQHTDHHTKHT
jgi:hypothetical protein